MGYRQAAVLASTCFFLGAYVVSSFSWPNHVHRRVDINYLFTHVGVLFICLAVDYRILFMPLTEETIQDGFEFYTTFFKSPPAIKVCGNVPFAGVVC